MVGIEREVDRVLTLLRNKIRERGYTQLEVQAALGWGRSYISQLFTRQKNLKVEQVLLMLQVIGVDPAEFYGELYSLSWVGVGQTPSTRNAPDRTPAQVDQKVEGAEGHGAAVGALSHEEGIDHCWRPGGCRGHSRHRRRVAIFIYPR